MRPVSSIVDFDVPADGDWFDPLWFLQPDTSGTIPLCDGGRLCIPFDLTGSAVTMKVWPSFDYAGDPIAVFSTDAGTIVVDDAANGNVHMSVSTAQLSPLPNGEWVHITRAVKVAGGVTLSTELMRGTVLVQPRSYF